MGRISKSNDSTTDGGKCSNGQCRYLHLGTSHNAIHYTDHDLSTFLGFIASETQPFIGELLTSEKEDMFM